MRRIPLIALAVLLCVALGATRRPVFQSKYSGKEYGTAIAGMDPKLKHFLKTRMGTLKIPSLRNFRVDMLDFYYKHNPRESHPAYCTEDFNFDGVEDHAFILVDWAGSSVLVILNGVKGDAGRFEVHLIEAVRGYVDDYLGFMRNELHRGNYEKDANHIKWSEERSRYETYSA